MSERRPILNLGSMSRYLIPECVVCNDVGCEFCSAAPEPWPAETFAALGDVDLAQLIEDAATELARRAVCGANPKELKRPGTLRLGRSERVPGRREDSTDDRG